MPFDLEPSFFAAAERELGATLPASYRAAMLLKNGGDVEGGGDQWVLYPIADTKDRKRLSRTCNHIIRETQSCRAAWGFPASALAIAANGAGDHLVMLMHDGAYGPEIHEWRHETGTLVKIANDFSRLKRI